MRLIVAEKPSLARAIAEALPGRAVRRKNHLVCDGGDMVAWCAGHVLELSPPEDYDAELKRWQLDPLPILPSDWKHRVTAKDLVSTIRSLLAKTARVVHAGDPDREGQLLIDEVLEFLGWSGPTDRLLVTDTNPDAVRAALRAIESNAAFRPLNRAAVARQRADWLFGVNLTRLYTIRARQSSYDGVVSIGRVQTPLLGLVVQRDEAIERFSPTPHYAVDAWLSPEGAEQKFAARWTVGETVGEEVAQHLDSSGRLLSRPVAEALCRQLPGKTAVVVSAETKPKSEPPPLLHSLATLQVDASKRLGISAARVLELAQKLYERGLLTYPRSDCRYLPQAQFEQRREVLRAARALAPGAFAGSPALDLARRSAVWNDAKVTAHHAIVPAALQRPPSESLAGQELALYELVSRRFLQQFAEPFEYSLDRAEFEIDGRRFAAKAKRVRAAGWKALEAPRKREPGEEDETDVASSGEAARLPPLERGQSLPCLSATVVDRRTEPPKRFTDSSLVEAMCQVARFVADPKARKILRDADGIGTPATRASIIETLCDRGYVTRTKNQLRSTPVGRALVQALPPVLTSPDLTAVWETAMRRIQDGELDLDRFLATISAQLTQLVAQGKAQAELALPPRSASQPSPRKRRSPRRTTTGKRAKRASKPARGATA